MWHREGGGWDTGYGMGLAYGSGKGVGDEQWDRAGKGVRDGVAAW